MKCILKLISIAIVILIGNVSNAGNLAEFGGATYVAKESSVKSENDKTKSWTGGDKSFVVQYPNCWNGEEQLHTIGVDSPDILEIKPTNECDKSEQGSWEIYFSAPMDHLPQSMPPWEINIVNNKVSSEEWDHQKVKIGILT